MSHSGVTEQPWPWPETMDAVHAAPASHRVLLDNDRVRVLEVVIEAGVREPEHTHRAPSVMIVDELAIALTLLVIAITVPATMGNAGLPKALLGLWPRYLAYLLSFVVIARFWVIRHQAFRLIARYDMAFIWLKPGHRVPAA